MFPDKIKITDELIKLIIDTRKEYHLTAYQLSEKIGKNKSWLPNIENKRTKNIAREDLILLFKDFAKDKDMDAEEFAKIGLDCHRSGAKLLGGCCGTTPAHIAALTNILK